MAAITTMGGEYYEMTRDGLRRIAPAAPDVWICRRVADFPDRLPPGGQRAACAICDAPIVFNPKWPVEAPKICMQCAGIEPLPVP